MKNWGWPHLIVTLKNEARVFQNENQNEIRKNVKDFMNEVNNKIETYIENGSEQEPITWSIHVCCTLESTHSRKELFLEQAFPRN